MVAAVANADSRYSAHSGELERWVFSGAVEAGLYFDGADADFNASPLVGPRATNIGDSDDVSDVVQSEEDSNDVLSGLVGGNLEVMTPGLRDVPSHPRMFMDLSLLGVLAAETAIARNGNPGDFGVPDAFPNAAAFIGELILSGHGTEVTSQNQGFQLHIGIGSAFTFDFGDERIRIKPSVVYSRTETIVSAVARRAVRIVNSDPIVGSRRLRSLDSYRLIELKDEFTEVYHGLGPALEIEYETRNRIGPFAVSLFAKGAGTHLFGDLKTKFVAENPDEPLEVVRWNYKNERWTYRVTTGIRFRFVPRR